MAKHFPLSPRYRLDDESPWLEGIDPSRHYWIAVNGDRHLVDAIPGIVAASIEELRSRLQAFRHLQPGEQMTWKRTAGHCTVYCISQNCFGISATIQGAPVWHLFDQETLESLFRTAHPDWQCAPRDLELGRRLLSQSLAQTIAA